MAPIDNLESPYRPPQYDGLPSPREADQYALVKSGEVLLRWTVVCFISAAPSFVLGMMMDGFAPSAIAGMICGILVFVALYCLAEHHPIIQRLLKDNRYRRTAKIGYGTRVGMSILFPVGFYIDLFVGILSVPIGTAILKFAGIAFHDHGGSKTAGTFATHFVLTVTQGVLLNAILFVYLLVVFSIVAAAIGPPGPNNAKNFRRSGE